VLQQADTRLRTDAALAAQVATSARLGPTQHRPRLQKVGRIGTAKRKPMVPWAGQQPIAAFSGLARGRVKGYTQAGFAAPLAHPA